MFHCWIWVIHRHHNSISCWNNITCWCLFGRVWEWMWHCVCYWDMFGNCVIDVLLGLHYTALHPSTFTHQSLAGHSETPRILLITSTFNFSPGSRSLCQGRRILGGRKKMIHHQEKWPHYRFWTCWLWETSINFQLYLTKPSFQVIKNSRGGYFQEGWSDPVSRRYLIAEVSFF